MEAAEATHLYGGAILAAVDRLQADELILPQLEAKICLAIHAAVEEAFSHTILRDHMDGFLGELRERVRACLMCTEAHLRQTALPPMEWVSEGDE
jgi:hypothetical protein